MLNSRNLSENQSLTLTGSNHHIFNSIGANAKLTVKGSGNLSINEIGNNAEISVAGSENVTLSGNVTQCVKFNLGGRCHLHFQGTLCEDVQFHGETCGNIMFDVPPSPAIAQKAKAAQDRALISDIGFNTINGYTIKAGSGWVRVKENGKDSIYHGSVFKIVDGIKYMDNVRVDSPINAADATPQYSSLLSTIDSFSTKRPFAFLAMTLGLGILWYIAKLIYYASRAILNALGAYFSNSTNSDNAIEINCGSSPVNNTAGIANAINLDPNNSAITPEPPLPPPPTPHLKTRRLAIPVPGASSSSPPSPSSSLLRP